MSSLSGRSAACALLAALTLPVAEAQSEKKPNVLFIMADDVGWMQIGAYHQGLMSSETPNLDRLAREGVRMVDYYGMQSCTSGRNAFVTGMYPMRTGLIPPQLPGSPTGLKPGTPSIGKLMLDQGYATGEFGKNHLGDQDWALPTAHGFQEFWGYLYHLDAMQGVSFPDVAGQPPSLLTPPRPVLSCTSADGTIQSQRCQDAGPLTLERSETVDEEISAKVVDFIDRQVKAGKPFFAYYNPARMHVITELPPKYESMLGVKGGKDWGVQEAGMKQLDDNVGVVLQKLEQLGVLDDTLVVFTTDNGAEVMTWPDGGTTPFRGQKGTAWEGGYRVPMIARWPGHIEPGQVSAEFMVALDWVPTLVNIAGGPKGDQLKKTIEAGRYPGFTKTTLDGYDQRNLLEGKSKSARDTFFYYSGATLSAVRWKNWKFLYEMSEPGAEAWIEPLTKYNFTLIENLKRDPFEAATGNAKSALYYGDFYQYDWNLLPIGQKLALQHLLTFEQFPPMQSPASYNLDSVMEQIRNQPAKSE